MFTPTQILLNSSGGNESRNSLNLNHTLCTVVDTISCDKSCWHSNCSSALCKSEKTQKKRLVKELNLKKCISNLMQFYFSGICLSLSCDINSVCNSLFQLSVNER
ncbi:hypothetical protein AMECASPLE_005482 [Ameca splendens]|uniref:Uncharacterized protein n=1 Tax=Ameca splendens TaxID=208324 RepID=A0ABV0XZH3_9TELE